MNYDQLTREFNQEKQLSFKPYHDIIFTILANNIIMLKIPPNSILRESHLAESFNVSRTPVRQALIKLEENYFVKLLPNRSYTVQDIKLSEFENISMLRSAIECVSAQQAASRATKKQIANLGDVMEKMKTFTATSSLTYNVGTFTSLEAEFHDTLCMMSQNPYLIQQYNASLPKFIHLRYFYSHKTNINSNSPEMRSMYEEHLPIYLAIKSGNPTLAYESMRQHINRLLKCFIE